MNSHVPLIDAAAIDAVLPMSECIELMRDALRAFDGGAAVQPLRTVLHLPDQLGSLYTMPAFTPTGASASERRGPEAASLELRAPAALAVKLITVFHGNDARGMPTHQGLVVVFDPETGVPVALIDAARLTAIRTAAVTAVATATLARADVRELAILGAGVQARTHIEALLTVRPFRRVRIWSRTFERAAALADAMRGVAGVEVNAVATARSAVEDADVICTVTAAPTPVLEGGWLAAGAHVNAVGASTSRTREIDSDAVASSTIFVDSIEGAQNEAGDLLIPWSEGRIPGPDVWIPLGAVLNGTRAGRERAAEITLFKSLGLAVEDAAAAAVVAARVRAGASITAQP